MTTRERLRIAKEDLVEMAKFKPSDFPSPQSILRDLCAASMVIPGAVVGAVKYAPVVFAVPTYMRRGMEKSDSISVFKERSEFVKGYNIGKGIGGLLSNLLIHGGLIAYTVDNDCQWAHTGGVILTNGISQGYEYWRSLGKRVAKRAQEGESE